MKLVRIEDWFCGGGVVCGTLLMIVSVFARPEVFDRVFGGGMGMAIGFTVLWVVAKAVRNL